MPNGTAIDRTEFESRKTTNPGGTSRTSDEASGFLVLNGLSQQRTLWMVGAPPGGATADSARTWTVQELSS
jgi:hypothetical protein